MAAAMAVIGVAVLMAIYGASEVAFGLSTEPQANVVYHLAWGHRHCMDTACPPEAASV